MTGPVTLANLFGCFLSIALLVLSLSFGDGMSLIATILLSLTSTLVGLTNKWRFNWERIPKYEAPAGDVVVRWPNGSFLVLKCNEDVARELFFRPDTVDYSIREPSRYIPISIIGTVALMLSVIALANAKIQLQIAWAGAYILLNIAHWIAAALPRGLNFDFPGYIIKKESLSYGSESKTFTNALWRAIVFTGRTAWVEQQETLPQTRAWKEWLSEAGEMVKHVKVRDGVAVGVDSGEPVVRRRKTWQGEERGVVYEMPDWDPKNAWSRLNERIAHEYTDHP